MSKSVQVLLTENVDSLGIVGDVVSVRAGYARNYLLPFGMAMEPSEEAVKALAEKRAEAQRLVAAQRKQREVLAEGLEGFELTIERSCNDQGVLYGGVTQQEIAEALESLGHVVRPRDVRLTQAIKRVDTYEVPLRFDTDLSATIKLWVVPDRKLDLEETAGEEVEVDAEGNMIEPAAEASGGQAAEAAPEKGA